MKNEWTITIKVKSKQMEKRHQKSIIYEASVDCISETAEIVINRMVAEAKNKIEKVDNILGKWQFPF